MMKFEKLILLVFAITPLALWIIRRYIDSILVSQLFIAGSLLLLAVYVWLKLASWVKAKRKPENREDKSPYGYTVYIVLIAIAFMTLGKYLLA